jgi:CheY-like chemotaxis protein
MSAPIPVALLGFSTFERNALASYFRLAPRSQPSYVHVLDVDDARFVVADSDQAGVPELLDALGRVGDAVFIGTQSPDAAAAWMMRPIDPAQVLRELDNLLTQRDNPSTGAGPLPISTMSTSRARAAANSTFGERGALSRRAADDQPAPVDMAARRADAAARRERRLASLRPVTVRRALLVDDSEIALAFLERHLVRLGVAADWAMNSNKALELMSQRPYGFVFLDVDLGEKSDMDGLELCQHIKRRHTHPGGRAPVVVLVSAFHEAVDRVRGTLAGADEQLGKPLDIPALERLLDAHGIERVAAP